MLGRLKNYYLNQDKFNFYCLLFNILATLAIFFLFSLNFSQLPSRIPLFYSRSWGDPQLASLSQFLILPLIIILITMTNLIISWQLHSSQVTLKRVINLTTAMVALLILITSIKILYIFV